MAVEPVFILGFPRSGTTAMARAVCTDPEFFGARYEGHFVYLFRDALDRVSRGAVNPASIVMREENRTLLQNSIANGIDNFIRAVYGRQDGRWIDKTPDIAQIRALPVINRLFPGARYIFLFRGVLDAVRSNIANWPQNRDVESLARRWKECQETWRAFRETIDEAAWLEVDQRIMVRKAAHYTPGLAKLLGISEDRASGITGYLLENRTVNTPSGKLAIAYKKVTISDDERTRVLEIAGEEDQLWPEQADVTEE